MRPVLITGATGTLGAAFVRACAARGLRYRVTHRDELDIASAPSVAVALALHHPWLVINTAGYVRVDDAEDEPERCRRENVIGAVTLAQACHRAGTSLVTFSSDLVFDGRKGEPYDEGDPPFPLSVYGQSKADAEAGVLAACPDALVIRTSAFFGPHDDHNLVTRTLRELAAGKPAFASRSVVSPTYVPELVSVVLDLAIDGEHGLWHLANRGATSWVELIRQAAEHAKIDARNLSEATSEQLGWRAPRPTFSALSSRRYDLLGTVDEALARYTVERAGAGW